MATQFLVRTPGNKHAINLKTILHDEIELIRIDEDGMAIFELPAADVVVELVVRRQHNSSCQPLLKSPAVSSGALEPAAEAKTASTTVRDASLAAGPLKRPNVTAQAQRISEVVSKLKTEYPQKVSTISNEASPKVTKKHPKSKHHGGDRQAEKWNARYNELVRYHSIHGSCFVPKDCNNTLYYWIDTQRQRFREQKLPSDRIQLLNSIGFSWNAKESKWYNRYTQLMLYKRHHGHTRVPQKYAENPALGEWVIHQRTELKTGKMSEGRIMKLNGESLELSCVVADHNPTSMLTALRLELGFEWNLREPRGARGRDCGVVDWNAGADNRNESDE
eukprot:scaffold104364_cov36-Cyclotella_meneghiniana.AAC.2